jgi:hypothetical protein
MGLTPLGQSLAVLFSIGVPWYDAEGFAISNAAVMLMAMLVVSSVKLEKLYVTLGGWMSDR